MSPATTRPVLSWLLEHLPVRCLLCLAPVTGLCLCAGCQFDLPWNTRPCPRCALPDCAPGLCPACSSLPASITRIRAPFVYASPCDRLIRRFKHDGQLAHGQVLAQLLATWLQQAGPANPLPLPDALMPVPLHWQRLQLRGFNQAGLLARNLSRATGVPVLPLARRQRATASQQQLGRQARQANLGEAFLIHRSVAGKRLALVDDVVTTGATVTALANRLSEAGARSVEVWCLARTPLATGAAQSVIPACAGI